MSKNNRAKLLHALMNIENCNNNLQNAGKLNEDAAEIMKGTNLVLQALIHKILKEKEPAKVSLPVALELPSFLNLSYN